MAHAQKPHFVFHLNGRVHLNLRGSQFSRLLAAEVCASALVMLDTARPEVVWVYWLPTPFASFPFTSPPVRHRVPPHSERSIVLFSMRNLYVHTIKGSFALNIMRWQQLNQNGIKRTGIRYYRWYEWENTSTILFGERPHWRQAQLIWCIKMYVKGVENKGVDCIRFGSG